MGTVVTDARARHKVLAGTGIGLHMLHVVLANLHRVESLSERFLLVPDDVVLMPVSVVPVGCAPPPLPGSSFVAGSESLITHHRITFYSLSTSRNPSCTLKHAA
jgi:hypothetical protein